MTKITHISHEYLCTFM